MNHDRTKLQDDKFTISGLHALHKQSEQYIFMTIQETAEDGMAGLQSKFQNLNAKVNQNVDSRTSSIYKPKLLCNPAKNSKT